MFNLATQKNDIVTWYTASVLNTWFLKNQLLRIKKTHTTENKRCTCTCKLVLSLYRAGINNYWKYHFYSHIFQDFHIIVEWGLLVISHGHHLLFLFWNTRRLKAKGNHRSNFSMICLINIQSKAFLTAYFL